MGAKLGLSPQQLKQLKSAHQEIRGYLGTMRAEMGALRESIRAEMTGGQPNAQKVERMRAKQKAMRTEAKEFRTEKMRAATASFSPDQRKAMLESRQQRAKGGQRQSGPRTRGQEAGGRGERPSAPLRGSQK